MKTREKKHPLAIHWMHWINFPVSCLMIWSDLVICWSNAVYPIGFNRVRMPLPLILTSAMPWPSL